MDSSRVPRYRKAEILLADDDPGDQELTRRALAGDFDHVELRVVRDGKEALDYLLRRDKYANPVISPRPDLILLDLNMPRLNGSQVLEQLRKYHELVCIPVVVLTTSNHEEDITRCYALGCNSFISKPVAIEPFLEMVRELRHYWFELVALPSSTSQGGMVQPIAAMSARARPDLGASPN
ncbi:MAG TPA: response regulator [Pirellulales bacterium]|jgi:CheY-like chemotaxis protein|nr:response regulator [Pirellulales bacterium]